MPNFQLGEILLPLQTAIDRDEHIELVLREGEKGTVFTTPPTNLGDGLYDVPAESAFHSDVNAFVYEDTHARRLSLASSIN
jgi:hypothetical protein